MEPKQGMVLYQRLQRCLNCGILIFQHSQSCPGCGMLFEREATDREVQEWERQGADQ